MNRFIAIILASVMMCATTVTFADNKIGIVNFQKLTQKSGKLEKIRSNLEAHFKSRRDKLVKMEKQLKTDIEAFKRDSAVMSDSKKKQAQQALFEKQQKFEKEGQAYQQELSAAHNKEMKALSDEVQTAVRKVAEANKFDIIMQKENVPFSNNNLDITDKVLKELK